MSVKLSWAQHAQRIVAELLTLKDPYPDIVIPHVIEEHRDENGYTVITVVANNYRDKIFGEFSGNVAGGRVAHTRVGRNTWEIHVEK